MLNIVKFSKKLKKFVYPEEEASINGPLFNLHCQITCAFLFFASAMLSTKELVGKPMVCLTDVDKDQQKVIETFCWTNTTFTTFPDARTQRRTYHAYYQWVYFVLLFQAVIFYLPKAFWKQWERELMKHLKGSDVGLFMEAKARRKKKNQLADYFVERLQGHHCYTLVYWGCEFLCLVNVIIQALALDLFFNGGGRFLTYGWSAFKSMKFTGDVFSFPGQNTMDYIFPMRTKCTFHKYGPSGSTVTLDALCILEINSYNRYIFLAMWYWFLTLIVLFVLLLLYRVLLAFSPWLRTIRLMMPGKTDLKEKTKFIVRNVSLSDWWVLYMVKSNTSSILFEDLVRELFSRLSSLKACTSERKRMLSPASTKNDHDPCTFEDYFLELFLSLGGSRKSSTSDYKDEPGSGSPAYETIV